MGLAVGVWTTVARRTARVEAELVGGSAIDGIFCDGLSKFALKKTMISSRNRRAMPPRHDEDTDQSSHDIDRAFRRIMGRFA